MYFYAVAWPGRGGMPAQSPYAGYNYPSGPPNSAPMPGPGRMPPGSRTPMTNVNEALRNTVNRRQG